MYQIVPNVLFLDFNYFLIESTEEPTTVVKFVPATAKISADVQQSFVVRSAVKEPVFKLAGESVSSYRKQVCRILKTFTIKIMKRGYLTCSFDSKSTLIALKYNS